MLTRLYRQSGIDTRHFAIDAAVAQDILDGTRHSASMFLPSPENGGRGPTTAERMQHYAEQALPLTLRAARQALERAAIPADSLTHLITVSCTGFAAPGVDIGLIQQLPLRPTVQRTHVGFMGCHGAINGLRLAQAFADADPDARVLLCAVELCSLHFHYGWDLQKLVANSLFADGAASVVGGSSTAAPADSWRIAATGSCLFPETEEAMGWRIGERGFDMHVSPRVPGFIARGLRPWLHEWLHRHGLAIEAVRSWAVHPGGPRILNAVEECLMLEPDSLRVSREVLAACGNMSSPTVLFILDRLRNQAAERPCVMLGFGPGLAAEAALVV
jgi:predicted naringenin-chalcone synthase